jgi:small subunit ribosomal protein S14
MAKKSMIGRDVKRFVLITKYQLKRNSLKDTIKKAKSIEEKFVLHRKLQKLPRNSSPVRFRNRCTITGRPRGFFRDFGLSRHVLREYASQGLLPGVKKSSW